MGLQIPVVVPTMSNTIVVSVWDWDLIDDERIATFTLDYTSLKQKAIEQRWYNLYGAPEHRQDGIANKMNSGYMEGTFFRGRVLLSAKIKTKEEEEKEEEEKDLGGGMDMFGGDEGGGDDY